jgi:hypothetical protein
MTFLLCRKNPPGEQIQEKRIGRNAAEPRKGLRKEIAKEIAKGKSD